MYYLPHTAIGVLDTVYQMDALDLMRALPERSVDMALLDTPYGTTECSWDTVIPLEPLFSELRRVVKPRGAIVMTATEPYASLLRMAALDLYKYDWVWVKTRVSNFLNAKLRPLNVYELCLVFSRGTVANATDNQMNYFPVGLKPIKPDYHSTKRARAIGRGGVIGSRPSHQSYTNEVGNYPRNVLHIPTEHNVGAYHPTQKPVALFAYLIRTYTQPGDVILDPVVGSGTTAIAARQTNRRFIVGDSDAGYVETTRRRLAQPFTWDMFDHGVPESEAV